MTELVYFLIYALIGAILVFAILYFMRADARVKVYVWVLYALIVLVMLLKQGLP